jgi:competence protein ComEC
MTLFWMGLLWLGGILLASFTRLTTGEWLILSSISFLSIIAFRHRTVFRILYLSICIFTLGAARYQANVETFGPDHIAWYNDSETYSTINGVVVKPPDIRDSYIGLQVDTETFRFGARGSSIQVSGRILVRTSRFDVWAYGDRVLIQGFLETPPEFETFDYREYLARKDVYSIVSYASVKLIDSDQGKFIPGLIYELRANALRTIKTIFPDPEASLLSGILVGMESGIPKQVQDDFNATGTTHIIAISGFKMPWNRLYRQLMKDRTST